MDGIVKIQINALSKRLQERRFTVEFTDNLYKYLADKGYDPMYGARPLKRIIQREVENLLANEILSGKIVIGKPVKVDAINDEVVIR